MQEVAGKGPAGLHGEQRNHDENGEGKKPDKNLVMKRKNGLPEPDTAFDIPEDADNDRVDYRQCLDAVQNLDVCKKDFLFHESREKCCKSE